MSARERILGRLKRGEAAGREAEVAARLAAHPAGPVPAQGSAEGPARVAQFVAKAEGAAATVSRIAEIGELPAALAEELRNRNLPAAVRHGAEPLFRGLDWGTVETSQGVGRIEEPATLSRAEFGLAETGTLVLASGADNPVTLTFRLVAGGRMISIHGWPTAGGQQYCFCANQTENAATHVDQQHTGKCVAVFGRDEGKRAVLFHPFKRKGEHLFHKAVDDLNTGEVALVDGTVERLSGKCLVME
jgi:hypothetical protein